MEYKLNTHGAKVIRYMTKSYELFGTELQLSEFLILLIAITNERMQSDKDEIRKQLIDIYNDPENEVSQRLVSEIESGKLDGTFDLSTYEVHYGQMAFSRSVDNLLTYFKDILGEVVLAKPEIMTSDTKVEFGLIQKYETIEELKLAVAEKKIESLFYAGIDKISKYFNDRLGITLFKDDETKKTFEKAIKHRNLIVHNRGRVSEEYQKDYPDSEFKLGEVLYYTFENLSKIHIELSNFVSDLDEELAVKFNLDRTENPFYHD